MGKIIGIDLGTTNSCVAIFEGKNTTVISNSEGKKTIPSIVAVTSNGFKVGESAKRQSITNPQRTVFSIKRFIEEKYSAVKKKVEVIPYNLQASPDGKLIALIDGKQYTPQEISAYILQKMKKTAEEYLDIQISEAGLPQLELHSILTKTDCSQSWPRTEIPEIPTCFELKDPEIFLLKTSNG